MGIFSRSSSSSSDGTKPGTDWAAKKAAAGRQAKGGTAHDKRAPKTDSEILDMIEGENKGKR